MFGLHDLNCFFRAACALLDRWKTRPLMWKFRWCSTAHLNQSLSPQTVADSGTGSRLFEVNIWMWLYGRAFPRKISVEDAEEMLRKRVQDARRKGAEAFKRRRLAALARQAE